MGRAVTLIREAVVEGGVCRGLRPPLRETRARAAVVRVEDGEKLEQSFAGQNRGEGELSRGDGLHLRDLRGREE